MDIHAPHSTHQQFRPHFANGLLRSIILAIVTLATISPFTASVTKGEDEPEPSMGFTLRPRSCSADGGATEIPVFTEDTCTGVERTFALTGPNGLTEEFSSAKKAPGADFEAGPYFSDPDGPYGEGEWTISDLDHTSGTWVIPSCWNGNSERGITPAPLTYLNDWTYGVEWEDPHSRLNCEWFELRPADGSATGDTLPHPLHLETIPTQESQLEIGGPGDELVMRSAIEEQPDIAVPMRLIDQANGEEISFEADADSTLLISPGEYELINELTGESRFFSTSREGATIALVGVPLDAVEESGSASGDRGDGAVTSAEMTSLYISVSTCDDIVNGTGIDCRII